MTTADENMELATEVAGVLLTKIKASAQMTETQAYLKELAEAYAVVRGAMPRPARRGRVD